MFFEVGRDELASRLQICGLIWFAFGYVSRVTCRSPSSSTDRIQLVSRGGTAYKLSWSGRDETTKKGASRVLGSAVGLVRGSAAFKSGTFK